MTRITDDMIEAVKAELRGRGRLLSPMPDFRQSTPHNSTPRLHCSGCAGQFGAYTPTPHRFVCKQHAVRENVVLGREMLFRCEACGTSRRWGLE